MLVVIRIISLPNYNMTKPKLVTTPLRYPGGKAKAIAPITKLLGTNFSEYREPFVGGGSIFIYLRQTIPHLKIWINDLNPEVYHFWKIAQSNNAELVAAIRKIKEETRNGKALFLELANTDTSDIPSLDRAVRFFVLNRISYAGAVGCSRYSQSAFSDRFTNSAIERVEKIEQILDGIKITNLDYSELVTAPAPAENVAIFADPPYLSATDSKLYGSLHTNFDHSRFAQTMQSCTYQWLVTYDNTEQIRSNFAGWNITEWDLQYSMTNKVKRTVEKELFVQSA